MSTFQGTIIKQTIEFYLHIGVKYRNKIIQKVVDDLGAPRPTVRRIVKDLVKEYQEKVIILQRDEPNAQ